MSALSFETLVQQFPGWALPSGALALAFLGSPHCALMCGGISAAAGRNRRDQALYQGSRLSGYLAIGALAGAFGKEGLAAVQAFGGSRLAAAAIAIALLIAGIRLWQGQAAKPAPGLLRRLSPRVARALQRRMGSPIGLGLATGLLPCGWLHAFVLLALSTGSPGLGAAVLGAVWLGSLPALAIGPALLAWISRHLSIPAKRVLGTCFIALALLNLVHRSPALSPPPVGASAAAGSEHTSCHEHAAGPGLAASRSR